MGSVWLADHLALKTQVAVKFILAGRENDSEARERFSREAEAAAQVKSPHVAQIFDHGVIEDGIPFIVMELLEGEDLSHYAAKGRLGLHEVSGVITQVCRALSRAHSKGLIHRDVKPANIFLCDVGTKERFVKLLDFGVAKMLGGDPSTATKSGAVTGTPVYMSPEQLLGAKDLDHRADLWSVAVVAYELMAGRRPFQEETAAAIALRLHTRGMPAASDGMIDLPTRSRELLDGFFAKAWALDRNARFESASALAEEFDALVRVLHEEQGVGATSHFTLPIERISAERIELTVRELPARHVSDVTLQSGRLELPKPAPKSVEIIPSQAPHTETAISTHLRESHAAISAAPSRTRFLPLAIAGVIGVVAVAMMMRHRDEPITNTAASNTPDAVIIAPAISEQPRASVVASVNTPPPQTVIEAPIVKPSASVVASATGKKPPPVIAPKPSASVVVAPTKKLEDIE
jgi:eukaryotic-like serine/threonine-protein kinase